MDDIVNIKEQIDKLILLQQLDAEKFDLQSRMESFPVRIGEIEASLEEKTTGMKAAEEELKAIQVAKNEKETDLQAKEDKISKLDGDLYQIKNNKEYQALQQEIDSIKADVSLIEEDILLFFDKIEEAKAKQEEEKKIFEEEKAATEKEKEQINAEEKELSAHIGELDGRRAQTVVGIDPDVLGRYEAILANRGRVALVKVDGDCCGGCHMQLRPQIINEAKMRSDVTICENCSRILYAED